MIKKVLIAGFLSLFCAVTPLFPQNDVLIDNTADISSFEKRFKAIDETVLYLKKHNIDISDITPIYSEAEALFREIRYPSSLKDYNMASKFLSEKLTIVEEKSSDKVSFSKSMNIIYILMLTMGCSIVIVMTIYSAYMYSRRK